MTAEEIGGAGAMAVIMRDALKPNLMQTLENTPVLVHAGPFGNIAHGNSSVVADRIGIHGGDYLITEAGFGADMGAERFFNIKCRASGLTPDAAVVVATVRALKAHSGQHKIVAGKPLPEGLLKENPDEVHIGGSNLRKQIENIRLHGVSPVVAINAFPEDHPSEHAAIAEIAAEMGARVAVCTHFADGGRGARELAEAVAEAAEEPSDFRFLYPDEAPLTEKIETIATKVYGADGVDYTPVAARQLATYERNGYGHLPVCIAKTHLSLSSDAALKGAPTGWRLPVREVRASVGAGFIYPICGNMSTMPGLGAKPNAYQVDIDDGRKCRGSLLTCPHDHMARAQGAGTADHGDLRTAARRHRQPLHAGHPPQGRVPTDQSDGARSSSRASCGSVACRAPRSSSTSPVIRGSASTRPPSTPTSATATRRCGARCTTCRIPICTSGTPRTCSRAPGSTCVARCSSRSTRPTSPAPRRSRSPMATWTSRSGRRARRSGWCASISGSPPVRVGQDVP